MAQLRYFTLTELNSKEIFAWEKNQEKVTTSQCLRSIPGNGKITTSMEQAHIKIAALMNSI